MSRKLHPADIADQQAIDGAASFSVYYRHSAAQTYRTEVGTLAEARRIKHTLDTTSGRIGGRRAGIYANIPGRAGVMVTDAYRPDITGEEDTPCATC